MSGNMYIFVDTVYSSRIIFHQKKGIGKNRTEMLKTISYFLLLKMSKTSVGNEDTAFVHC